MPDILLWHIAFHLTVRENAPRGKAEHGVFFFLFHAMSADKKETQCLK